VRFLLCGSDEKKLQKISKSFASSKKRFTFAARFGKNG
jgi:hypothetical protein